MLSQVGSREACCQAMSPRCCAAEPCACCRGLLALAGRSSLREAARAMFLPVALHSSCAVVSLSLAQESWARQAADTVLRRTPAQRRRCGCCTAWASSSGCTARCSLAAQRTTAAARYKHAVWGLVQIWHC